MRLRMGWWISAKHKTLPFGRQLMGVLKTMGVYKKPSVFYHPINPSFTLHSIYDMRIILLLFCACLAASCKDRGKKYVDTGNATGVNTDTIRGRGMAFDPGFNQLSRLSFDAFTTETKMKVATPNSSFFVEAPPPGDQRGSNSCVGWAVGYCFLSSYLQRHNTTRPIVWNGSNIRSPGFVYHFSKLNNDCVKSESYMHVGLECIRDNGSCKWDMWPGNGDCNKTPLPAEQADGCSVSSPWKWGKRPRCPPGMLKIPIDGPTLWQRIDVADVNSMKAALLQYKWPVIAGFVYTTAFGETWSNGGYWIRNDNSSNNGGHAVCIVGFDDNKTFGGKRGMFKCQNSYGTRYGDGGYFWVSYQLVTQRCFNEVYIWVRDEPTQALPCLEPCPM